jgi:diguanylate cyclase (GGDEF)-like protein
VTGRIRVLLVEDNPGDARWVREMLGSEDTTEFEVVHTWTVSNAVDHLTARGSAIDAVLLDLTLPDESGLATLQRVVAATQTAVVIVMTGQGDEQTGLLAMQGGAQDYLVKGQVDGRTLRRAVRFAIERQSVLQRLSHRDDLTGLHNRRGFVIQAEQLMRVSRRQRAPLILLFMDLDALKTINDTFGHSEGNRAIIEAADVLRRCFRQSDLLARVGGDEFAALALTSGDDGDALIRARLEGALDAVNAKPDRAYPLSFSVGIVTCEPGCTDTLDELIDEADREMYREKRIKAERPALRHASQPAG